MIPPKPPGGRHRGSRWALLLGSAVLMAGYLYLLRTGQAQELLSGLRGMGLPGMLLGILVQTAVNTLPVPGSAVSILLLELYGPVAGWICSFIGAVAGAVCGMLLAKRIARPVFGAWVGPYLNRIEPALKKREAAGLLLLRYIPLIPYHLLNYAAGMLDVRMGAFIWTTALGVLPYTLAVSGLYTGLREGSLLWGILGLVLMAALAGIGWLLKGRTGNRPE